MNPPDLKVRVSSSAYQEKEESPPLLKEQGFLSQKINIKPKTIIVIKSGSDKKGGLPTGKQGVRDINLWIITPIALFLSITPVFLPIPATAQGTVDLSPPGVALPPSSVTVSTAIQFILNILVLAGIIAALIFLIYSGLKWILSGGDKSAVESARNSIIAAVIGLAIIVLAWVIVNIIFEILGLGGLSTILNLPTLTNPTL